MLRLLVANGRQKWGKAIGFKAGELLPRAWGESTHRQSTAKNSGRVVDRDKFCSPVLQEMKT
jgi:hypothetical protein